MDDSHGCLPPEFFARLSRDYNAALVALETDMHTKRGTVAGAQQTVAELWTVGIGMLREIIQETRSDQTRYRGIAHIATRYQIAATDDMMNATEGVLNIMGDAGLRIVAGIHAHQKRLLHLYVEHHALDRASYVELLEWLLEHQANNLLTASDMLFGGSSATLPPRNDAGASVEDGDCEAAPWNCTLM